MSPICEHFFTSLVGDAHLDAARAASCSISCRCCANDLPPRAVMGRPMTWSAQEHEQIPSQILHRKGFWEKKGLIERQKRPTSVSPRKKSRHLPTSPSTVTSRPLIRARERPFRSHSSSHQWPTPRPPSRLTAGFLSRPDTVKTLVHTCVISRFRRGASAPGVGGGGLPHHG